MTPGVRPKTARIRLRLSCLLWVTPRTGAFCCSSWLPAKRGFPSRNIWVWLRTRWFLAHVSIYLGSVVGTYCCRTAIGIEKESYEFVGQLLDAWSICVISCFLMHLLTCSRHSVCIDFVHSNSFGFNVALQNAPALDVQHQAWKLRSKVFGRFALHKVHMSSVCLVVRSLREDCRTNRRKAKEANSFIRSKQSRFVQQTPTRKAHARGDTTAYALKPTRAYAPNQDCLRKAHAAPFLYKPFHLIKIRCSHDVDPGLINPSY